MSFTLDKYIDHLGQIQYYNYSIHVNYYDLRFVYKNTVPTVQYTLQIWGVVDLVETREYLIYSRNKTDNHDIWDIRIPEIQNSRNRTWNAALSVQGVNTPTNNISAIPNDQYVAMGSDYENFYESAVTNPQGLPAGKDIKIYTGNPLVEILRTDNGHGGQVPYGNKITLRGPKYIAVNTNERIRNYVIDNYNKYNSHPTIKLESPDFNDNDGIYYEIPLGVARYKVILAGTNGEKIEFFISNTLQNNLIYSPNPILSSSFSDVPAAEENGSIIIDNDQSTNTSTSGSSGLVVVPDVRGMRVDIAEGTLILAGLRAELQGNPIDPQDLPNGASYNYVTNQNPSYPHTVLEESAVTLYFYTTNDQHDIHHNSDGSITVDPTCFEGSCRIYTPNGWIQISKLNNGDSIYTLDENFNLIETQLVDIRKVIHNDIVNVFFKNGINFRMTAEQPLMGEGNWISFRPEFALKYYPELQTIGQASRKTSKYLTYTKDLVELANVEFERGRIDTYQVVALTKGTTFIVENFIAPIESSAVKPY